MATVLNFLGLAMAQHAGRQTLPRTPERQPVTSGEANVAQYDQALASKLAAVYACGLEVVHRARHAAQGGAALDLACGPGHFSLALARDLGCETVSGIDLSPAMIAAADVNATRQGLAERVRFRVGDVTRLDAHGVGAFDLTTMTEGAHHLPDLPTVRAVLAGMDRVTRPDGLVMVMDLARLRTARITERYVRAVAADYAALGLNELRADFRASMYAAWTVGELRRAVPARTQRCWFQLVPRGLPMVQIVLGLPVGRRVPFVRAGAPWAAAPPVPPGMIWEWRLLRRMLFLGARRRIGPRLTASPVGGRRP